MGEVFFLWLFAPSNRQPCLVLFVNTQWISLYLSHLREQKRFRCPPLLQTVNSSRIFINTNRGRDPNPCYRRDSTPLDQQEEGMWAITWWECPKATRKQMRTNANLREPHALPRVDKRPLSTREPATFAIRYLDFARSCFPRSSDSFADGEQELDSCVIHN